MNIERRVGCGRREFGGKGKVRKDEQRVGGSGKEGMVKVTEKVRLQYITGKGG